MTQQKKQPFYLLLTGFLLAVNLVSCGENKIAQCNQLSAPINKTVTDLKAATEKINEATKSKSSTSFDQRVNSISAILKELQNNVEADIKTVEAVTIKDVTLKQIQSQWLGTYEKFLVALKTTIDAFDKKDQKQIIVTSQNMSKEIIALGQQEKTLMKSFNEYCGAKEPTP